MKISTGRPMGTAQTRLNWAIKQAGTIAIAADYRRWPLAEAWPLTGPPLRCWGLGRAHAIRRLRRMLVQCYLQADWRI